MATYTKNVAEVKYLEWYMGVIKMFSLKCGKVPLDNVFYTVWVYERGRYNAFLHVGWPDPTYTTTRLSHFVVDTNCFYTNQGQLNGYVILTNRGVVEADGSVM